MRFIAIQSILSAIISLLLGLFVYFNNKNAAKNKSFLIFTLCVFWWLFFYSLAYLINEKHKSEVLIRMGYVGVTFIVITAYNFISVFLNKKSETKLIILSYIIGAFFVLPIFFSNLLLKEVFLYSWGYYPYIGSMHLVYMVFLIAIIARFVYLLYDNYRQAKMSTDASEKNRSKYMLMASIIFSFAAIDFLPGYHINIYPFGFIFVLLFSGLMTYAILRHQLLDIQIIIKRTLVFAGLLASIFAILVLPTLLIQEYIFRSASAGGKLVGLALSGVIIILFLRRIESFLINVTDKYLFQKKYSYRELLKTFTTEVLTVVNMDKLLNLTVDKLVDVVKISSSAVLLLNEEKRQFDVAASRNVKDSKVTLLKPDGIVTFLEHTHGYLLKRELAEKRVYIPPEIQEIIDKLNAELIIPMVLHTEVKGILSLGKKKSDEDYTQDDLDILLPLARTLAIAISNAKLFDELGKTQAEAAQREKMAVIGTLSAGINHEICNPLGIARGQCEAFLLNLKDGLYNNKTDQELLEKSKDIMAKVIKETDRATAITKKLSGFAKPSKGEEEIIVIDKEIDDVLDLVGYELKLEKIEFEKCIENNLPNIFVDKKQFQEVLFNLIRNAGQAIGEKGKITVIAKHNDGKILIDIKDTGSGVPENKIRELFNPFFTTKEPGKGTGLGLFIVRQVVEKNGGKIYLKETRVGEGTTFTVEFPAITAKESGV